MLFDDFHHEYRCGACGHAYQVKQGVVNGLTKLSNDTRNELLGMIRESGESDTTPEEFMVRVVEKVDSFEERCALSRDMIFDYYGSCLLHFKQAADKLEITGEESVVEVGSELDFPFLQYFSEKGCECFATNIYFRVDRDDSSGHVATRTLGDMNCLPYADESFDIVLFSATLHHSNDLELVASEIARILKPGGTMIAINEPVAGLIKQLSKRRDCPKPQRHDEINENEYSLFSYLGAFKRHGLTGQTFFPNYYDIKLQSGQLSGQRFGIIGKVVSRFWQNKMVRKCLMKYGLPVGQVIIGLQFNAILKKSGKNEAG